MRLTFLQDHLHHDAVSGLGRLRRDAQCVTAVVVHVVEVSHVSADPAHACGGAERARPAQLSHLRLTAQSAHTQAGPHHQSQQPLFDLLRKENGFPLFKSTNRHLVLIEMVAGLLKM